MANDIKPFATLSHEEVMRVTDVTALTHYLQDATEVEIEAREQSAIASAKKAIAVTRRRLVNEQMAIIRLRARAAKCAIEMAEKSANK